MRVGWQALHESRKRRRKLYEKISAFLEIPQESVADIPVFVLRGRHELEAEGCTGVLEYEAERIILALAKGRITVLGNMLELSDFSDRHLCVRGNIESVSFGDADGGDGKCL